MIPSILQQLSTHVLAHWLLYSGGFTLIITVAIASFWWRFKTQTAQHFYTVAMGLYQKNRPQEALKLLEKAFEKEPTNHAVLYNLGFIHMALDDRIMAKRFFERALVIVPDDALSLYNLGLIDYDNECYEAAITNWLGCIQYSHETDPDLYYGLGLAYEGMQQWQTALEVYERSCQLHPEHLESKISTARLAYELGEMAHAKTLLDELLIDNDENEDSLLYAALVAAALQDWEAAQLHAAKLLTLDDEHAHAFNVLGVAYFHLKRYEDAEECFEAALELDDQWVSPMSNLAYVYEKQGRLTNAKMRFRQVQTCRALTLQLETDSYWMLQYLKDPQQAEAVQAERLAADAAEEVEVLAEPLYYRGKVLELVKKSILVDVVMPPAEEDEAVLDSVGIDQNPAEATD